MPAQAVLGSRAPCHPHFPEREGELLDLPFSGLQDRDHSHHSSPGSTGHGGQQPTGALHACVPWTVPPLRAGRLHPPLMAHLHSLIGTIARLRPYFCARMCLKETIIIDKEFRACLAFDSPRQKAQSVFVSPAWS